MLQYVIVCIIIACAAFYLVWQFRQTARRIRQQGKCADCPVGALCAGGCRSYNYFTNGGKLYENILCARSAGKK